jgi:hypothetical protein
VILLGIGIERVEMMDGVGRTYVLSFGDLSEVDFDFCLGEDVGGGGHVDKEVCGGRLGLANWVRMPLMRLIEDQRGIMASIPCTVAFAPAADRTPIVPTITYPKTRFDVSPRLLI